MRVQNGLILSVLLSLGACGASGPQITEVTTPPPAQRVKAIVLLPIALAMEDSSSLDIAMRTSHVSHWLLQKTQLPIVGPADFSLLKPVDEVGNVAADTDLMSHATELRVPVREAAVLTVLVTESRATHVRDIQDVRNSDPKKQKTFRQHGLEAKLRIEVSLAESLRGRRLAGLVLETTDDPTDVMPGGDPRPGLTEAIDQALEKLLETAGGLLTEGGKRQVRGVGLVDSLPAMLTWAPPGKRTWTEQNKDKADVEREAATLGLWDRLAVNLSGKELYVAGRNRGVLVRQAQGELQAGDLVLSVEGTPVVAVYQLDRILQAGGSDGVRAQVLRGGQPVDVRVLGPLNPPENPSKP